MRAATCCASPGPRAPDVQRRVHPHRRRRHCRLAAARALRRAGHEDFALLELEDRAGGNSRGTQVMGIACPQGAHYLPLPGDDAPAVQDLLEELGLRQRVAGRWQYDERPCATARRSACSSAASGRPGCCPCRAWARHAGAVPPLCPAGACRAAGRALRHSSAKIVFAGIQLAQDAITFEAWLTQSGLDDAPLRWYLDYCCRDDYGAGLASVSAWAGLHYFASRHGFQAPGQDAPGDDDEAVLTWPQGNGWLAERLAAPLGERLQAARVVGRIAPTATA
jgi:hypothetical protein